MNMNHAWVAVGDEANWERGLKRPLGGNLVELVELLLPDMVNKIPNSKKKTINPAQRPFQSTNR